MNLVREDLFEACPRCLGKGYEPGGDPYPQVNPCEQCAGTHEILTPAGLAVADVVKHFMRPPAWEQRARIRAGGMTEKGPGRS